MSLQEGLLLMTLSQLVRPTGSVRMRQLGQWLLRPLGATGAWVVLYLVLFTLFALVLKKEYWKDVH